MKITELDSKGLRKAMGNAEPGMYSEHYKIIDEVMSYDFAKPEVMKILNVFNYGVAIGKNQERNRRKRK